jgi:hypothetical protein
MLTDNLTAHVMSGEVLSVIYDFIQLFDAGLTKGVERLGG